MFRTHAVPRITSLLRSSLENNQIGKSPHGRTQQKWKDQVENNIQLDGYLDLGMDLDQWRAIMEGAKYRLRFE